jgi:hypothetical protein
MSAPVQVGEPGLRYKFVELTIVTAETIEQAVNEWVGQGWAFDGIRFVTTEASRRPCMAFVSFVRRDGDGPTTGDAEIELDAGPELELDVAPRAAATDDVSGPESPSPSTPRRRR